MKNYIVRIRSYYNDEVIQYGTGIIIADTWILTAEHVVCGNRHTVEISGCETSIKKYNSMNGVVVLMTEENLPWVTQVFSSDEILDESSKWSVEGYIGTQQKPHEITGTGFHIVETSNVWDCSLINIVTGSAENYVGLSGSPVFCDGRIVGILQMQSSNRMGLLGIRMTTVKMFEPLLSEDVKCGNEYLTQMYKKSKKYTEMQLSKNLQSKKYIPSIFVEEGDYKEKTRYFAEPFLFVTKTLKEIMQLDFREINAVMKEEANEIDFNSLNVSVTVDNIDEVTLDLTEKIHMAIDNIRLLEERIHEREVVWAEFYNIKQNLLNSSIRFAMGEWAENLEYASKKYLLITKAAGQGKTNFLCDFTNNFLIRKGYLVLYYNAYQFNQSPMLYIHKQLTMNEKYSMEYVHKILLREWERTKRSVMIIIDGLNENTFIENFGQCMRDFLEECQQYPYIKVIMSTRNELFQERFGVIEEGSYQESYKKMDMWRTGDDFKNRIFRGYMQYFDISIRPNALSQRAYDLLTDDVLLLRFFCEVNEHQQQIYLYDVYKYEVFQQYIKKKAKEYHGNEVVLNQNNILFMLLDKIVRYMIEKKEFFHVPVSVFTQEEERILIKMLENEVIFKDEQVIKSGILEKKSMTISFTFDEFRDFCITNYLLEHFSKEDVFMQFWKGMRENNLTIREGVQKYVFYLSRTKYQKDLGPIVEKVPEYDELYWLYIWGVQDDYLSYEDVAKWKEQVLQHGSYGRRVVNYLLMRYDCDCFHNLNIKILFELMDEIIVDMGEYHHFMREMFGAHIKDDYKLLYQDSPKAVYPYNYLVRDLLDCMGEKEWNLVHRELFRLTIYLFELRHSDTLQLWENLYQNTPDIAVVLLQEMNTHDSSLIQGNVIDILEDLLGLELGNQDERLHNLCENNRYKNRTLQNLSTVFEFVLGDKIE